MPAEIREVPVRSDGLQLTESPRLQSLIWTVQRVIWFLSFGVVVIALLGLTGRGGPWAAGMGQTTTGLVDHPRVMRRLASDVIAVRFTGPGNRHSLGLGTDFLSLFEVQLITPRPLREEMIPGGSVLRFPAIGAPPHIVHLTLRARQGGILKTDVTVDGEAVPLSLTILP